MNGFFFESTVLDDVIKEMTVFYEETFGTVIPLSIFEEKDQVIKATNAVIFDRNSFFSLTTIHTVANFNRG